MTKRKTYPPPRTRQDVTKLLGEVMADMLDGRLSPETGNAIAYLALVFVRVLDAAEGKPAAEPPPPADPNCDSRLRLRDAAEAAG
jgi:hypothetical protein